MKKKAVLATVLAAALGCSAFAGCGEDSSNVVDFWVKGSTAELEVYGAMVDAFNNTYGKEHGITAKLITKTVGAYDTTIPTTASTASGPDVFITNEDELKKNIKIGLIADITDELAAVEGIDQSDIYENILSRYHYDITDNSSETTDPIYGLPLDSKISTLYYNETLFREAGILVISVDEEDLEAFWAGTKADNRGLMKADYIAKYEQMATEGLVSNTAVNKLKSMNAIPAKGYYRETPMYGGADWVQPTKNEVLIFNNRIAMNWDESEDLAYLFDKDKCTLTENYRNKNGVLLKNTDNGTVDYGFFSEWWFMYGWSVGGDCLTDLTGKGDFNFSLLDPSANYIVAEGKTYEGEYTGYTYQAGETLEFLDKMDIAKNETVSPVSDGTYKHGNGSTVGIRASVEAAAERGDLQELPSTRKAFERYVRVGTDEDQTVGEEKGLGISPYPNNFLSRKDYNYFFSGKLAMMVQYSTFMPEISEFMEKNGFEYDVAPLLVYKEYNNPGVATDASVKVAGKEAGQSNSIGMVVRERSSKKEKAAAFVAWMASAEGQKVKAQYGFFPNQTELLDEIEFPEGSAPKNIVVFKENMLYQTAGDWWYLQDYDWVNTWAQELNSYVRNGGKNGTAAYTYEMWASTVISKTNNKLKSY